MKEHSLTLLDLNDNHFKCIPKCFKEKAYSDVVTYNDSLIECDTQVWKFNVKITLQGKL